MTFNDETERYTLSTGKTFYANNGILGLSIEGDGLYEGYDSGVHVDETSPPGPVDEQQFTPREKQEIAIVMIKRWQRWGALR